LKLKYDEPLSNFTFNFKLSYYKKGLKIGAWGSEEDRKKHWFFMPEETLAGCQD
jgi:hypothetical protein